MDIPLLEEWYDGMERVLNNGMRLWAKSDERATTFAIRVCVLAGSFEDPPDRPGCAHCFEHIPFRGAGRFTSKLALADPLEERDGSLNAHTWYDKTQFEIQSDPATRQHALDVLAAMLLEPHYSGVEAERETIFREYRLRRSQPPLRAFDQTMAMLFKNQAWQHMVIGTEESIKTMTADHLRSFHQHWYSPGNMLSTIVGPDPEDKLLDLLEERFSGIPPSGQSAHCGYEPVQPPIRQEAVTRPWELGDALVVCATVFPLTHEMDATADVLRTMLAPGMSSPILRRLREEASYFYTFDLKTMRWRGFGMLAFMTQIAPQRVEQFWEDFWQIPRGDSELTARRLAWARNRICADRCHEMFRSARVADAALSDLRAFGSVQSRNADLSDLLGVSLDQILHFCADYYSPGRCLQVSFVPEAT